MALENLNIIPYARSASHAFQTRGVLREWDNGWDNCWHNGDWVDGPHPWKNACAPTDQKNGRESVLWNDKARSESPAKLRDAIFVRDDGFIHNRINEVVFYADKPSIATMKSLLDTPLARLAETNKGLMELLWLD